MLSFIHFTLFHFLLSTFSGTHVRPCVQVGTPLYYTTSEHLRGLFRISTFIPGVYSRPVLFYLF